MAKVLKSGARKPLAEGNTCLSWGENASMGQRYTIRVSGETHSFSLDMTPKETFGFIRFVAQRETFVYGMGKGGMGWSDKRGMVELLRALADKLESEEDAAFIAELDKPGAPPWK